MHEILSFCKCNVTKKLFLLLEYETDISTWPLIRWMQNVLPFGLRTVVLPDRDAQVQFIFFLLLCFFSHSWVAEGGTTRFVFGLLEDI